MKTGRLLAEYLRPYRARAAWACAAMVAVSAFNGLGILLLKPIIDEIFFTKDFSMLWIAVAAVPLLVALKAAASYTQNYLLSWIGQKVIQQIREDLFFRIHELPLEFHAARRSADVLSKATGDLSLLQGALTTLPVYGIRDGLTVLFLAAALFRLDARFAALALLGSPLSLIGLYILSRKMRRASRLAQTAVDRLHHRFQESLHGMTILKAYNDEDTAIQRFRAENDALFQPMMTYLRATALSAPLMEVGASVIVAAVLYFGGREVFLGRMTAGAFFAFLGGLIAAYAPLKNLARTNAELQRAWTSADRLFSLLREQPSARPRRTRPFPGLHGTLRFEGAGFRYPERRTWALKSLELEIKRGSRTAVVGPSGSGKSTLGRLLLRLYDPTEGRMTVDGIDAKEYDATDFRSRSALVTAEAALFNDSVFRNVALGRAVATLSEVESACRAVGAAEFIELLPEGYSTVVGDFGLSLSAGQRQKISLARVLLRNPDLVVLDEATAHLDGPAERDVRAALETVLRGRTVVVITHDLRSVWGADHIAVMSDGCAVEAGSHPELLASGGLYRRLFDLSDSGRTTEPA